MSSIDEIDLRVQVLEEKHDARDDYKELMTDCFAKLEAISNNYLEAIKIQANSLSLPLMRDVLIPVMMKVFGFFALVVLGLLTSVFGIKWGFDQLAKWFP